MSKSRLGHLQSLCECGVSVNINEHKDIYESVDEYMVTYDQACATNTDILKKMIETNTIICVQAFPDYPSTSYACYHYDLEAAIEEVIKRIEKERERLRLAVERENEKEALYRDPSRYEQPQARKTINE